LRAAVETAAPTGNADGGNPERKRGWQWVKVTPVVTVFLQGLSRSAAAAIELLGNAFGGILVSDRFSAYNHLPVMQRQLCWAHLIRDLTAIAERPGVNCWRCSSSCLFSGKGSTVSLLAQPWASRRELARRRVPTSEWLLLFDDGDKKIASLVAVRARLASDFTL
jgi:hypothetical protein